MNLQKGTNPKVDQQLILLSHLNIFSFYYILIFRNLNALAITDTELKLMANAAIIGESNNPKTGYKHQRQLEHPPHYKQTQKIDFVLYF